MSPPVLLVVEDELLLRLDMADLAQDAGFETVEAADAAEAMAILESDREVRVVVTDVHMPGALDGIALAHMVRDRWPAAIIIICSGQANPHPDELPAETIFLSKPCTNPDMRVLLRDIFLQLSQQPAPGSRSP